MATKEETSSSPTVDELKTIFRQGKASISMPLRSVDEVYENVFVGGEQSAKDKGDLKQLGVTHVLNCAQGTKFFHVNTSQDFYRGENIKFCGLEVSDFPQSDIKQHFDTAVKFMDEALAQENGKVLVHCVQGFSRSATVAIAYLMMRKGMTVEEAGKTVRQKREVGPNNGFLKQLIALDEELQKKSGDGPSATD